MVTHLMVKVGALWQSCNMFQKGGAVLVGIYTFIVIVALVIRLLVVIDRRWVRYHVEIGTIMRMYMELPGGDGCWEVREKREGVRYMIDIGCAPNVQFKRAVHEDLFDIFTVGHQLSVEYESGRISGIARLRNIPSATWPHGCAIIDERSRRIREI